MTTETEWMRLTAEELRARAAEDALVIVPVASLEQHGPHLATGVDIILAGGVAARTAARIAEAGAPVVVTPCVWTGLAEHHMEFGGTVTLDYESFAGVLRGIVKSAARHGFKRVMLLNGHGGNSEAVMVAAGEFSIEFGIRVAAGTYWHMVPEAIAPILERQAGLMHACEAETSLMLALRPDSVRTGRLAEAHGPMSTRVEGQPPALALRRSFRAISETGVIGDARVATAEKGERLLAAISARIAELLLNPKLWA
ncbi:creatininase family protein [Paracraurococcus lichenis]|uniref:Creatininase family protein n=1 Tax=Paracraurococcus lichenis TaxID=3064888 RepID=A0ABT9DZV4_9PROT|nr:creatininase family protein [Paracraurococcus sp. LOR1-02]MDO9709438.1 creatininase family protein [Paracraurococcus sp. LOR1-02]